MFLAASAVLLVAVPFLAVDAPAEEEAAAVVAFDEAAPGDALELAPTPVAVAPASLPRRTAPVRTGGRSPAGGVAPGAVLGGAAALAAIAATIRRRRDDPMIVLVHGDGGDPHDFDTLLASMDIGRSETVAFDYRTVAPGRTSTEASRRATAADAAVALDELIRDLTADHGTVYSIHHSKGGAVGVEMIAALDDGTRPPIPGYIGASLLDPAIGAGGLGALQRLGGPVGAIPDNGGFDPVRCGPAGCRDIRAHLGERSGVEVIAIRNPDAMFTNFVDRPPGLRVLDLVDDGGGPAIASWWNPIAVIGRVFEAHGSVLVHDAVASCIGAEIAAPGSCRWTGSRSLPRVWWGRGRGHNQVR